MLNLQDINWRQDSVTRRYIKEHKIELTTPNSMSPEQLAGATTFCQDVFNPYAEELTRRAGLLEQYLYTPGISRIDVVREAARRFNIQLI